MAADTRPRRPNSVALHALAAPCVSLPEAAQHFGLEDTALLDYAEAALLPPWVAQKQVEMPKLSAVDEMQRWRFAVSALDKRTLHHLEQPRLWLHRICDDDCDITQAWLLDPEGERYDIRHIAEWCRVAQPDGLRAGSGAFALWCSDHSQPATMTTLRHDCVVAWWDMLQAEGSEALAHGHPGRNTHVTVLSSA